MTRNYPTMQRRHFELVAETIAEVRGRIGHEAADHVTLAFMGALAPSNHNFDRDRFKEACGWRSGG